MTRRPVREVPAAVDLHAAHSEGTAAQPSADLCGRVREDILSCRLQPGQRLKIEELRLTYEVSTGTMREALSQLSSEGIVSAEPNRGFAVMPVSVFDLLDITEMRVDLECKALTAAIEAGDDEWEAEIIAAYHLLQKLEPELRVRKHSEWREWSERHRRFHDALVAACPSPWLLRFRRTLFDQARRYRGLSMKQSGTPGRLVQHRKIMDAALARDVPAACALVEAHIRDTSKNILESLKAGQRSREDQSA